MQVFSMSSGDYSGVIQNYTELYREIYIIIYGPWTTKGSSLRRLLRTSESNTELYRGIHFNIYSVALGLQWATSRGHVVVLL